METVKERIDKSLSIIKNSQEDVRNKLEIKLAKKFFEEIKEILSKNPDGYIYEYENGWKGYSIEEIALQEKLVEIHSS